MNPLDIDVVLVEDDARALNAMRSVLQRGWRARGAVARVRIFRTSAAALDSLDGEGADLVLADYRLAGLDGIEVLRRAHTLRACSGCILLSASADYSFLLRAVNPAVAGRVMLKPWLDEELLGASRQAVELGRLMRDNAALAEQARAHRNANAVPSLPAAADGNG